MKTSGICILIISLVLLSAATSFALDKTSMRYSFNPANSIDSCAELIKECMAMTQASDRNVCFKESAENLFCSGNPLGALARERWQALAVNFAAQPKPERAESLLVDQKCIDNFDNLLTAKVILGKMSGSEIEDLKRSLESCRKTDSIDLQRQ